MDGGNKVWVKCGHCASVWVAAILPMAALDVAKVLSRCICPSCASTDDIFIANKADIEGRPSES